MVSRSNPALNPLLYPYMFVLKAGDDFKTDMMDFSLSIWHLTCQERLPGIKTAPLKNAKVPRQDLPF